jgi:Domain of unknown function (DUF4157)
LKDLDRSHASQSPRRDRRRRQVFQDRARVRLASFRTPNSVHPMLRLQRMIGNNAVWNLLRAGHGPAAERAAPNPQGSGDLAHDRTDAASEAHGKAGVGKTPGLSGAALDPTLRAVMELRFGHDFSQVRVHTDTAAAASAAAVGALAYTVGQDVVFARGNYAPGTRKGRRLLTHELAHVVEQDRTAVPVRLQRATLGEELARFFGAGTYTEEELTAYLRSLDTADRIEDDIDSDNKARAVVERWVHGDSRFLLPVRRKTLLIQEMLSGFTGDDDERAILQLLRGSTDSELAAILASIGRSTIEADFHGEEARQLNQLLTARGRGEAGGPASGEVFPAETVLPLQERFTSNAENPNRLNCILIIRELAPQLFAQDPELAEQVRARLGELRGRQLKMTEVGRLLSELGAASAHVPIRFNNGNGRDEPTAMESSAWDAVMDMVGNVQGWHVLGMAVFNGYHSVTVLVDNRPDGPRLYWADQWRIDPGEDFHQEPGSAAGFRRYEKGGFDRFLTESTRDWWNEVLTEKGRRYAATLHIWKFRSQLEARPR